MSFSNVKSGYICSNSALFPFRNDGRETPQYGLTSSLAEISEVCQFYIKIITCVNCHAFLL